MGLVLSGVAVRDKVTPCPPLNKTKPKRKSDKSFASPVIAELVICLAYHRTRYRPPGKTCDLTWSYCTLFWLFDQVPVSLDFVVPYLIYGVLSIKTEA